jgi:hypothetical protein
MRRRSINWIHSTLLILALLVASEASAAQQAKWFEIGLPAVAPNQASIDLLLLGVRVASLKPFVPGIDCSIVTLPVALTKGVVVLGLGFDATFPIRLDRGATLTPRVGGSALTEGSAERRGAEVTTGYNAGVGLVARTSAATTVRLDITHHWLAGNLGVSIVTIGFQMH